MRPLDLSKLRGFYMIAREGNMTRAAEKLNVSQPSLSQLIDALEHNMKTKLFERFPRGMRLTAQGEQLYAYATQVMELTDSFEKYFYEKEDEIEGEIKILTTPFMGSDWLIPILNGFLDKYPKLTVKILLRNDNIDPSEADVVISTLIPHQPHLIQKHLFSPQIKLFASQAYLKKFGTPQTAEDLNHHRLITYRGNYYTAYGSTNWILNVGIQAGQASRKSYLEIDSLTGMLNSAMHGYGIVELPNISVVINSGLKEVLPETIGPVIDLYYIFPEKRKNSKKINLLFKYLAKKGK